MDGNFVLNFGPDGLGRIRMEEKQIAKEIGDWMKTNQEAVYNCGYAPLKKQDWGYFTKNRITGQLYMIIFNLPIDGKLKIEIGDDYFVESAYLLDNNGLNQLDVEQVDKKLYSVFLEKNSTSLYTPITIKLNCKKN